MISVIDMPPPEESMWWRGKRGFDVGFFPSECVRIIGDKVPAHLSLPGTPPATVQSKSSHHLLNQSSGGSSSSGGSTDHLPMKPVLRKHGKLISFFRYYNFFFLILLFILSLAYSPLTSILYIKRPYFF